MKNQFDDAASVIDTATNTVVDTIPVGNFLSGIANGIAFALIPSA